MMCSYTSLILFFTNIVNQDLDNKVICIYVTGVCVYGARRDFRNEIHLTKILLLKLQRNEFRSCMSQNALPSQPVTNHGILLKI